MGKWFGKAWILIAMLALVLNACSSGQSTGTSTGSSSGTGTEAGAQSEGDEIKIGMLLPMTGPSAAEGQDMANGAEMAAKEINDAGGVLGKKIKLIVADDACDPQMGATAANKLVTENVNAVVGGYCSGSLLPASGIFHKAGIPVLSVGANSSKLVAQGFDNLFIILGMVNDQAYRVSEYLKSKNLKNIALIHDNSVFARDLADSTKALVEAAGGKIVAFEAINPEEKEFGALMTKLKSLSPDATYFTGFYNAGGLMVKQFKQKGVPGLFMAGDGNAGETFIKIADEKNAEGVLISQNMTIDFVDDPKAKEFIETYKKNYNSVPLTYASREYDGIRLVADAIKRANSADKTAIKEALKETKDFPTFDGTFEFKKDGTLTKSPYIIVRIENGKFVMEK